MVVNVTIKATQKIVVLSNVLMLSGLVKLQDYMTVMTCISIMQHLMIQSAMVFANVERYIRLYSIFN